jgi:hypothetical protein
MFLFIQNEGNISLCELNHFTMKNV